MGACAAAAVALLAGSPFVFVFTRIAILEPLLILLMLLALLVAWAVRSAQERRTRIAFAVALGGLFALMVGTKTTAIFLLPAIGFLLGNSANWRPRRLLLLLAVAGATAALLWSTYLALLVHAGYFQDFRYLFDANGYTAITAATLLPVLWATISDGMWMGPALYPVVLLVVAGASFRTEARRDPVFVSLLLWAAGYMAFMAYHANMQPRYYLVVVVPLVLAAARGAGHLLAWRREASWLLAPLTAALLIVAAATTVHFARHPEYSFQAAAERIERIVEAEPNHSHTVLSISGSNLSLMTGLPSICDDFGTMNLEDRIAAYHPGWFVAWNYVEDDKMAALGKFYRLTRVAAFPAMDDPERNLMIVYRLDPREGIRPRRRKPGARILPTALGVPASP
jgi:MFS family permease